MSRHHNRALLSEITEKQLDPKREYVVGKHGLTLSPKELKKESDEDISLVFEKHVELTIKQKPTSEKKQVEETKPQIEVVASIEAKLEEQEFVAIQEEESDSQIDNKNDASFSEKDSKNKKKIVKK